MSNATPRKIRAASESVTAPRKSLEEIFKSIEQEVDEYKPGLVLAVKGLPDELFGKFVTATPKNIDRAMRDGYIPYEDVLTEMGHAPDGDFVGSHGTQVKFMVCRKEYREMRNKRDQEARESESKAIYRGDDELPTSGHRKTPPKSYIQSTL